MAELLDHIEGRGDLLGMVVAHVGEKSDVLERVGAETTAGVLDALDHHLQAVVVLRLLSGLGKIAEVLSEELVGELAVSNLHLHGQVCLMSALTDDALVGEVKIVVTRVDRVALVALILVQGLLVVVLSLLDECISHSSVIAAGAFKVTDWLIHEAEVAELEHGGEVGLLLDSFVLLGERFDADVVRFCILHPVHGEEISQAGVD